MNPNQENGMNGLKYATLDSKTTGGMIVWSVLWGVWNAFLSPKVGVDPMPPEALYAGILAVGAKETLGKLSKQKQSS